MDWTTIGIIAIAVIAIAYFVMRRGRVAPQGTYDDPDVSSSGSIGGGPRAHDDPNVSSGGSIGGGPRTYDSPKVSSGGSIGNQTARARSERPARSEVQSNRRISDEEQRIRDEEAREEDRLRDPDNPDEPTYNDRKLKSGGSFGSS
jgi:hypothetical protein